MGLKKDNIEIATKINTYTKTDFLKQKVRRLIETCLYFILQPNPLFGNAIEFPNSMWTAGCCNWNNGLNYESIAVMGNNDPNKANTGTMSMTTLGTLENILVATGKPAADLFPGSNGQCRANSQQI